jgi:hypothetical protein
MKKYLLLSLLFVLFIFIWAEFGFSQQSAKSFFTNISPGQLIENRKCFPASLQIDNFQPNSGHYWVAMASVKNNNNSQRISELCNRSNQRTKEEQIEFEKLIKLQEINQFWPKFYIKKSKTAQDVYDGGNNTSKFPQPIILLIIRVDDALNSYIENWFKEGEAGKGYPGIPSSRLNSAKIISRCEIFFP